MIRRKFDLVVMAVCLALLGYFGWHAFYGPRGFAHHEALENRAADLTGETCARSGAEREKLRETRIADAAGSIDPDMLDELARATLDYGKPSDLVISATK